MKDIRSFLRTRKKEIYETLAELDAEKAAIDAKISALKAEQAEIKRASKAIGMVNRLEDERVVTRRQENATTIKEAALAILRDQPKGLIALDILRLINQHFDLGLVRTSLSPQLSRLKQEGKIVNDGAVWRLTKSND